MTTAVIGATGRVGREIVRGLLARGDAVAALLPAAERADTGGWRTEDGRSDMTASAGDGTLSFARDVKPLFREKDRDSMRKAFDLFDYTDVAQHADAILGAVRSGKMPCDGAWPAAQVETIQHWIDQGKPA